MGYLTRFSATLHPDTPDVRAHLNEGLTYWSGHFCSDVVDGNGEETKWYDWSADLCRVTAAREDFYILIGGRGEDSGDIWREMYHGGQRVWGWKLDTSTFPDPPHELVASVKAEVNAAAQDRDERERAARIVELRAELAALERE